MIFTSKEQKKNCSKNTEKLKIRQFHKTLLNYLEGESKKDAQIKLLKKQTFTSDQLIAFLFRAYLEYGFSFSQYTSENLHKGLDKSKLPRLIHLDGKEVKTVGPTTLSRGQLRQVVVQRKVIIAKFLDKGNQWHCFFGTLNSIGGKESWNDCQSHLHYISDKWEIPRDGVVTKIKGGIYPSTPVHIGLLDYRSIK